MNLPKLDYYINDFSGILSDSFRDKYNNLFSEHQNKSWEQIATVFIEHRDWNELKDIALKLFNENGIWEKETNNWLLLIVSTSEKKIRIMTGKWMELEFSDAYCSDIIELELRALLNDGEYEKLVQAWYEISTKKREIKKNETSIIWNTNNNIWNNNSNNITQNNNEKHNNFLNNLVVTVIIIFFILIFFSLINIGGCSSSNNYWDSSYDWGSNSTSDWGDSSSDWWSSSSDWGGGSSNAWWAGD